MEHSGGPASWALLSCLCTPQLADIILAGCRERFDQDQASLSPSLHPLSQSVLEPSPTFLYFNPKPQLPPPKSPSPKSLLHHVSRRLKGPRIPLRSFPWSLGSSLCHVAQSEPSLGRITQLSMGGQMTIIRLHSSGPYLKREERSPGDLK